MRSLISVSAVIFLLLFCGNPYLWSAQRIGIKVENQIEGAPITLGIPFAQGTLQSPDHVRLLDQQGNEIPAQITQVTSWEPVDFSVKWIWVFFFSTSDVEYILEYGDEVRRKPISGDRVRIKNGQRTRQSSIVETGPLRFAVNKREGGFIDDIFLDLEGDGFEKDDQIADCNDGRCSFLDILDDAGIDPSTAIIKRTVKEKGSGPLHGILRLEGEYSYTRDDNRPSPFIIRIHAYAGKSYIRVYHTLTYTGVPDKHRPSDGEHAMIALDGEFILPDTVTEDPGWLLPNDRIVATGLQLNYHFNGQLQYKAGYYEDSWHHPGKNKLFQAKIDSTEQASVFQTGPKPDRVPPVPNSTMDQRIDGFQGNISIDKKAKRSFEKAEGWADISDGSWGIGIGIKNFLEEYPKEIAIKGREIQAFCWSPNAEPMSFARWSNERDQGMVANQAEGVTKTTELVFHFHNASLSMDELKQTMRYFLDPPAPHADPEAYAKSEVYGHFSPRNEDLSELERGLDYKFDWNLYNQHWEPWYGMFDYGDHKNVFYKEEWYRWINNEPAVDFMLWLQFMRTGDPKFYRAAEAMSRHTMDVDNVHWPTDPKYYGDTNPSIDYLMHSSVESQATPYLGIGRRHATQHWVALLSAHVWLQGWVASYYLTGYHRGLDVARLTADSYLRRIWGDHGLTGRRLYLSVWNLIEAWDATKDPRYLDDLKERIDRMLALQNGPDQYDALVIDRYGYSQIYASHSLYKYYQLTGDQRVKHALIRHARALRDIPPYNHDYESYFSSIHSLLVGYELTKEESFLEEAILRSEQLKTEKLTIPFEELVSQKKFAEAVESVSHLPAKGDFATRPRRITNWDMTQGLRVFGWTHIYNVPWLLYWLRKE